MENFNHGSDGFQDENDGYWGHIPESEPEGNSFGNFIFEWRNTIALIFAAVVLIFLIRLCTTGELHEHFELVLQC